MNKDEAVKVLEEIKLSSNALSYKPDDLSIQLDALTYFIELGNRIEVEKIGNIMRHCDCEYSGKVAGQIITYLTEGKQDE